MNMMKKTGGFTLVELIVVIAILAILAGVAVPAYSGYIKKADAAADNTLLNAVNKAFAAACIENSINIAEIDGASIPVNADGEIGQGAATLSAGTSTQTVSFITGVTYEGKAVAADVLAKINSTFARYYAGNENSTFKTIKGRTLMFDPNKGLFVDPQNVEELTVTYGGNQITVSGSAISSMVNSTFGGTIGGKGLLMEVAGLTNMVETGDIDASALLADENYMRSFASYLGIANADELTYVAGGGGTLNDAIDAAMAEAIEKSGMTDQNEIEQAAANAMINGFVYYAAEGTKDMTTEDVTNFLTSGNIAANLSTNQSTKLAQASMAYGMYTAFVNSEYNTVGATTSTNDPMGAIGVISGQNAETSAAFDKYIKSDEGKADIEAYMAAMDVINDSTGNDVTADVLLKGFDDAELGELLAQVLGK